MELFEWGRKGSGKSEERVKRERWVGTGPKTEIYFREGETRPEEEEEWKK